MREAHFLQNIIILCAAKPREQAIVREIRQTLKDDGYDDAYGAYMAFIDHTSTKEGEG